MPHRLSVSVVVPALDEEASIERVLRAIPRDVVAETIVVDGGSRDRTAEIARANGAQVVPQSAGGYGAACALGVAHAAGDIVVLMDADGAADPREIRDLLAPFATGGVDLVLGSRLAGGIPWGAMPWHQALGNYLCARLIRLGHGKSLTDLSPFRAFRRAALSDLRLRNTTYGWPTEMVVRAARAGWRIAEVPVTCHRRLGGRSKISGTIRGTVLATVHILRAIAARESDA